MIRGYDSQVWNCIVGLAGLPAVGPHLRREAVGKQYLLVAGQTKQVPKPHQALVTAVNIGTPGM